MARERETRMEGGGDTHTERETPMQRDTHLRNAQEREINDRDIDLSHGLSRGQRENARVSARASESGTDGREPHERDKHAARGNSEKRRESAQKRRESGQKRRTFAEESHASTPGVLATSGMIRYKKHFSQAVLFSRSLF